MAEYIEKHKAVNLLTSLENEFQQFKPFKGFENAMYRKLCETEIAIGKLPAADVVPVVHCKDCKHFNHKRMECENEAVSTDHEGGAQYSLNFWLDDFCSYGERRDGDTDNGV